MRHLLPIVTPRLVWRPPVLDDSNAIGPLGKMPGMICGFGWLGRSTTNEPVKNSSSINGTTISRPQRFRGNVALGFNLHVYRRFRTQAAENLPQLLLLAKR